MLLRVLFALCVALLTVVSQRAAALDARQLAVIVNTRDPLSVSIGNYYAARRGISFQNVIKVGIPPDRPFLDPAEFGRIKALVDAQSPYYVQAYAITWVRPFRVDCMSITTAFAFGFDRAFCAEGCKRTRRSIYFNSNTSLPYTVLRVRPTMAIAATSLDRAKALIDRGIASDGTNPAGTAYLLSTSDRARNVRSKWYGNVEVLFHDRLRVRVLYQDSLRDENDVLFYFTGLPEVDGLQTLRFVPGAIGDHLTSGGGVLVGGSQMSALRWLEAGATASYGTVAEPCNMPQKFPRPEIAIAHYLRGETLLEAYWKSVEMPGQGIFVGEPLAAPFRVRAAR